VTGILLRVELEPEGAALYEALRQQALGRLANIDNNPGSSLGNAALLPN